MQVVTKWSTLLINTKKVEISVETEFLHTSKKYIFQEIATDIKNHQKHYIKFNFSPFLSWPSKPYSTELVQSISQPEI